MFRRNFNQINEMLRIAVESSMDSIKELESGGLPLSNIDRSLEAGGGSGLNNRGSHFNLSGSTPEGRAINGQIISNETRQAIERMLAEYPRRRIQPINEGLYDSLKDRFRARVYPPRHGSTVALFKAACEVCNYSVEWAESPYLHELLRRESGGVVGVPNYTYNRVPKYQRLRSGSDIRTRNEENFRAWEEIWSQLRNGRIEARSSATGLGQLVTRNAEFYPRGLEGIGVPLAEAVAMLRYCFVMYGSPEIACRWHMMPVCEPGEPGSRGHGGTYHSPRALLEYGCKPGEGY